MSSEHISLIAVIVAVFFAGMYLRGERARKQDIKQEMDEIRAQQDKIIAEVEAISRRAEERDKLLLSRIDSARSYIDILNAEEEYTTAKREAFDQNIRSLQVDIDKNLASLQQGQGLSVAADTLARPLN